MAIVLQDLWDTAEASVVAPLNAQIATLQASLATAQAALAPLQAQVTSLQGQLATSQAALTTANAALAAAQAQIVSLNAEIDDLEAQITALLVVPVPSTANTGYRGGLGNYSATQFPTAHDVTIQNMQVTISAPLSIPGANIVMKNGRFNAAVLQQLTITGAGFVAEDFTFANVAVTGAGTFTRCNFGNGVTLNGVSVVKDSYVKGTLTTFAGSTLTNNTVVP